MIVLRYVFTVLFSLISLSCNAEQPGAAKQAEGALRQMLHYLRETKDLEFTTQFHVVDKVLGRNVKGSVDYKIRKPNLLHITATLPSGKLVLISDGKIMSIHEPAKGRYEELIAKDSIVGSIYLAAGLLGEQTRLVDFFWTVDYLSVGGDAGRVGTLKPKTVGSKTCDGYVVERGQDVWSVWLERSPLRRPCYIVSKSTGGSAFVTQTNSLQWTSNPNFPDGTFQLRRPAGHRR